MCGDQKRVAERSIRETGRGQMKGEAIKFMGCGNACGVMDEVQTTD